MLIIREQRNQRDELCKSLDEQLKELTQQYCRRLETYITDVKVGGLLGNCRNSSLSVKVIWKWSTVASIIVYGTLEIYLQVIIDRLALATS